MTTNDDSTAAAPSTAISPRQARWLDAESERWVAAGHLDADQRTRIRALYRTTSSEQRSMLALMLLGTLMFSIGVLLLVGYNWSGLHANVKVAILLASVAMAYAGSAFASARQHPTVADIAALAAVLLFGNALFLISQVLHMTGDLPDAFMWWTIGALVTAVLVRSRTVGIAAASLVLAWTFAAIVDVQRPMLTFAIVWGAAVWFAYRIGSPTMVRVSAVAAAFWIIALSHPQQEFAVALTALAACALYAVGAWHREASKMSRAWQHTALAILLVAFVPLLIPDFHDDARRWSAAWPGLVGVAVLALAGLSPLARMRSAADAAAGAAAVVLVAWLVLTALGAGGGAVAPRLGTIAFSVLSLVLAVGLIRAALQTDSTASLVLGVGFALVFLIVRWVSLIDSMLWSGLMLLAASAGFFVVARLWRGRRHPQPAAAR